MPLPSCNFRPFGVQNCFSSLAAFLFFCFCWLLFYLPFCHWPWTHWRLVALCSRLFLMCFFCFVFGFQCSLFGRNAAVRWTFCQLQLFQLQVGVAAAASDVDVAGVAATSLAATAIRSLLVVHLKCHIWHSENCRMQCMGSSWVNDVACGVLLREIIGEIGEAFAEIVMAGEGGQEGVNPHLCKSCSWQWLRWVGLALMVI